METLHVRFIPLEDCGLHVREAADGQPESRHVDGHPIVFGVRSQNITPWSDDRVVYEVLESGCITPELIQRSNILFCVNHSRLVPHVLGRRRNGQGTLDLTLRDSYVESGCDLPRTSCANDTLELIRRGDIYGMSFAFKDDWQDTENGVSYERTNETVDGWAVPGAAGQAAPTAQASQVAQGTEADDDPWAVPPQSHPQNQTAQQTAANGQGEEHHKHVAVPDLSDGIDPWATPAASTAVQGTPAQSTAASASASAAGTPNQANQPGQANQQNRMGASSGVDLSDDPWQMAGAPIPPPAEPMPGSGPEPEPMAPAEPDPWAMPAATAPAQPQVAADEDEYSMSDESLGAATAMSPDDIKRLFEVKKVEEFAADDPRNPRNAHQTTKHTEE